MVQTSAQRQKQYRQRQAIKKIRNDFGVTLMLEQAKLADIDVWTTLVDCALDVYAHNGDGIQFIKNVAPLTFAVLLTRNLIPEQQDRP